MDSDLVVQDGMIDLQMYSGKKASTHVWQNQIYGCAEMGSSMST